MQNETSGGNRKRREDAGCVPGGGRGHAVAGGVRAVVDEKKTMCSVAPIWPRQTVGTVRSRMTVGQFCNRQVVIARREEHVCDAAGRMRDLHVGTLVVVDEHAGRRVPVGVTATSLSAFSATALATLMR